MERIEMEEYCFTLWRCLCGSEVEMLESVGTNSF